MRVATNSILYLSPYFWPEDIGSAPYCTELARFLDARGYDVSTIAFQPHYPNVDAFKEWAGGRQDSEGLGGISIARVPVTTRGSGGLKTRVRNDLRYLWHVVGGAIRGRYKVDAIVAYVPSILTVFAAKLVKMRSGARIVVVVHDIESGLAASLKITKSDWLISLMRWTERIGLNFADDIVVLTQGMKDELLRLGCRRPITILSIWGNVVEETPIDPNARPIMMYSGNFGKKQNFDQLLPLLKRFSQENVVVDMVMQGGGSERDRIEVEVASRKISNVTFLPLAPADTFLQSLQSANVHLVPQADNVANYAIPSKLFSIMSAGRPFICIAEPNSPLDKLAADSNAGICVASGDVDGAFQKIKSLLKNPDLQMEMGANGRRYVEQNMNRDDILMRYEKLLHGPFAK